MRRFLIILCALFAIILCVVLLVSLRSGKREQRMKDGSIIRIEKVAYAREEHIKPGGAFQKLKEAVTRVWQSKFPGKGPASGSGMSSWYMNAIIRSNEPALYVYVTRRDPGKGYRSVDAQTATIIDEDGCIFMATQSGGWDDGTLPASPAVTRMGMQYTVGWFRFEAFPRRDRQFHFQLFETMPGGYQLGGDSTVEFSIANPLHTNVVAEWQAQPLPIMQAQDGISFALAHVSVQTNSARNPRSRGIQRFFKADYEVMEDGRPSTNWQSADEELYDAAGNFVAEDYNPVAPLCSREPAWKLKVKFFGSENSRIASNAFLTLPRITVPASGDYLTIDRSFLLQGIHIKVGAIGGPGVFTYSNAVPLKSREPEKRITSSFSRVASFPNNWRGKGPGPAPTFTLESTQPHLALALDTMGDDQRLTVRAVDDQGREFYGHKVNEYRRQSTTKSNEVNYLKNWYDSDGEFVLFDLPVGSKTVELTVCVHTCRKAEFIFKPPHAKAEPPQ